MVAPLLLALGILGGNQLLKEYKTKTKEEELASQYRGLLGAAPGDMGPPDESGGMGRTGGTGLLANPADVGRQMQFAAGLAGLPGQQAPGLNMLNAAMQRAQQEAQQQEAKRQFGLNYDAGRADATAANDWRGKQFDLSEREFKERIAQFGQTFGLSQEQAKAQQARWEADRARQAQQWGAEFGLKQGAADSKADGMPKLPVGYMYQPTADGKGVIAAPIPGTPDHAKALETAGELANADKLIGQFVDTFAGKTAKSPRGQMIRQGGTGTEWASDAGATLSAQRAAIIANVAKLRNMGVLQAGELERLEETLPDPTSLGSNLRSVGGKNSNITAAYEELRKQTRQKRETFLKSNPWLIPPLPPGARPME